MSDQHDDDTRSATRAAGAPGQTFLPSVYLDGTLLGVAYLLYDANGVPYYQYEVQLPKSLTGTATIEIKAESCAGASFSRSLAIK